MMPLFFILAGASVYYSLRFRTAGGFIKERTLRILIPLIIVGYFVIAPPQVYLERLTHGEFSGTFFQFYPHYFDGLYGLGGNFVWMGMHLWFLVLLFVFSLIVLPLLLPGKEQEGASFQDWQPYLKSPGLSLYLSCSLPLLKDLWTFPKNRVAGTLLRTCYFS